MTQTVEAPRVTGNLDIKLVVTYLKQAHKDMPILVERCEDGTYLISDRFMMLKTEKHISLFPFTHFDEKWQRATYAAKEMVATEGAPDCQKMWSIWTDGEMETLTMTHYLWENTAQVGGKVGQICRKLATYDLKEEKREILLDVKICNLLALSADDLEGFLFEQKKADTAVRVAAVNGYVAVIMPLSRNR